MKHATNSEGQPQKYLTPQKVAEMLSLNRRTVLEMIRRKEITAHIPVANRIRISTEEVERLLQRTKI